MKDFLNEAVSKCVHGTKIFRKCVTLLLLGCASAYAEDQTSLDWLLDIDVAYQQQNIGKSTADLTSVIIAPSLELGNWDLSLSLPWYEKQGEFYINGIRPRLITRCERITSLTPAKQKILIERGKITQKQLDRCDKVLDALSELNATHSGIGDITAFARYRFPLSADINWGTSFGVGYKADTGDSETGIGSGTKDGLLEFGVFYQRNTFSFSANAGYDFVSGDESVAEVYQTKNFAYTNINISKKITEWLTLGASFNGQQAYLVDAATTKIVTEYIDISPLDQLTLHFYISQYSGDSFLPDKELGANLTYSF